MKFLICAFQMSLIAILGFYVSSFAHSLSGHGDYNCLEAIFSLPEELKSRNKIQFS